MAQVRRTSGGRKPEDIRGEFTIVAVPGTHRENRKHPHPGTSKKRLSKAEKQKILLEARVAGLSWREAGKRAGYKSVSAAYEAGEEAIANIPKEAADEARSLEMQRIDEVLRANWSRMQVGDPDASNIILRAIDRRAKLLGLDLAEPEPGMQIDARIMLVIGELLAMPGDEFTMHEAEIERLLDASQRGATRARRTAGAIASGE
jgi:hypothetical protein